jgi:hypothetical protein
MKWEQAQINGKPQSHGIASIGHDYRIGKFTIDLATIYGLWHGAEHLGYFPDSHEAKECAESHLLSLR